MEGLAGNELPSFEQASAPAAPEPLLPALPDSSHALKTPLWDALCSYLSQILAEFMNSLSMGPSPPKSR